MYTILNNMLVLNFESGSVGAMIYYPQVCVCSPYPEMQ